MCKFTEYDILKNNIKNIFCLNYLIYDDYLGIII